MKHLKVFMAALLLAGCDLGFNGDEAARDAAVAWADAYFNCDFHEAAEYATPESGKWLRFAASNTTEDGLELLRERNAKVEGDDYYPVANDTLRVIKLKVWNPLLPTVPGQEARQAEKGEFLVTVVKRDGSWKVRMEGLPRSEKQSRD
ncbi:MAG: hypothetical protein II886_00525 [Prevotella sp.]|nr:hypothetical protein [Prevotella sp.]